MTKDTWFKLIAVAILARGATGAMAHDHPAATPPEQLGTVSFPVSCNAAAQEAFNRAMALFHSFWFEPAKKSFGKVLEHDPECGIAYWGIALMSMGNPFTWLSSAVATKVAAAAAAEGHRVGAKTARERDYIATLVPFFNDWENAQYRTRAVALEKAAADLAARHESDDEAQIYYALVLNATALPTDKTYANQLKAAAILEPLFRKYPKHPGVAHYLIHTYDYAELAER